jgi:lauroyl/myristoyl acyltransferase
LFSVKLLDGWDLYLCSVFTLIRGVGWLSSARVRELVVGGAAAAAYRFSKSKRQRIERRLREVFDNDLGDERVQSIVKGALCGFWQDAFSVAPCSGDKTAIDGVRVQGVGHLREALEQGRGVILWESVGLGQRTLSKQVLHRRGFPVYQVHAEGHMRGFGSGGRSATWMRNQVIKPLFKRLESASVLGVIYLSGSGSLAFTRQLLGLLESNTIVCVSGDGGMGQKQIPLQFLGRTRGFATGMVSLARLSGATILPLFCVEESRGGTKLVIEAPIHIPIGVPKDLAMQESLAQYTRLLESYVKRYPEQYWAWHLG